MYIRLSQSVRRRMEALQQPRIEPRELREVVNGHLDRARKAAAAGKPVDVRRAEQLHHACMALLEIPDLRDADYRMIQGACLYFADDEDDDGDFSSVMGLEDDVQVLNYVVASVGRPDLAI
jgi:hypothetical protein